MKSLTLSTVILVLLAVLSCTEDAQTGIPERNDSVLSNQKVSGNSSVQGEYFIDLKEAEAISSRFMNWTRGNEQTLRSGSREDNPLLNATVVKSDEMDTLMYVINYRKGFAIVSATKEIFPILAYSDEGNFDASEVEDMENNENIGLSIWWDLTKEGIIEAKKKVDLDRSAVLGSYAAFKKIIEGEKIVEGDRAVLRSEHYYDEIRNYKKVGPLLTTDWRQDYPFNRYTPIKGEKHAPAGCVPIAIAQVVNYHQRLDGENIDWNKIKENSFNAADLVDVISRNIKMCYTSKYSYPSIEFPNFFAYRKRITNYLNSKGYYARFVDATGVPETCPAIYEGFKDNFIGTTNWFGGHWWVIDGYETYEVYRGWGEIAERSLPHTRGNPHHEPLEAYRVLFYHFNFGWGVGKWDDKLEKYTEYYNVWYQGVEGYRGYKNHLKRMEISKK